ncbi:MAG TPA: peptidyl-prolyl cis-trans isomerase [Candidatus Hydrogenedentes bacterium]|nr:peptidyl-prolyl cis-trans isomerase [Candidatus Hydrogenedentota bacterium]HPG68593.1 peptidyl-prolyl cis-trans isomerase [Candidatus Hydrogenedentota bacterium]
MTGLQWKSAGVRRVAVGLVVLAAGGTWAQAPDLDRMDIVLKSVPDGPVARVNDTSIPAEEFTALYKTELTRLALQKRQRNLPDRLRIETALHSLTLLVQREVLHQEAVRRRFTVSDEELEQGWKEELDRVSRMLNKDAGAEVTEAELLEWSGLTREEARNDIRKELLIDKVREALVKEKGVTITDKEVADFFEKNRETFKRPDACHFHQIFVSLGAPGDAAAAENKQRARERIEKAVGRIRAGESFEAVAKDMSDAPDRDEGGDMGMQPLPALPPFFVEPAQTLKPGGLSEIIESPLGYHVVRLIEFQGGQDADLDTAKPIIERLLRIQKTTALVDDFCAPVLKEPGAVQVFLELDRTLMTHPGGVDLMRESSEPPSESAGR